MKNYSFSILSAHPGLTIVHHVEPNGTLWATSGRTILKGKPGHWEKIARFPFHFPRDLFGFSRPTARAMRSDKCNLYVNHNGRVLAIRAGTVYRLDGTRLTPLFPIQGDCVLHRGISEDDQGWTYFGEYFMNPARGEVRIYRLDADLDRWETAYTFPANTIRHVHGIFRDPFDPSALWASLGDAHGECHLIRTRDRFATYRNLRGWLADLAGGESLFHPDPYLLADRQQPGAQFRLPHGTQVRHAGEGSVHRLLRLVRRQHHGRIASGLHHRRARTCHPQAGILGAGQ